MRLLVAGAMYLASGALFSTIETVAGENPLCVATSLIVTAWFFSLGRFTRRAPRWPASSRYTQSLYNRRAVAVRDSVDPEEQDSRPSRFCRLATYSGGTSNDSGSRNQRVFQIPKIIPAIIQMLPTTCAGRLRLSHKARQIMKPSTGGMKFHVF